MIATRCLDRHIPIKQTIHNARRQSNTARQRGEPVMMGLNVDRENVRKVKQTQRLDFGRDSPLPSCTSVPASSLSCRIRRIPSRLAHEQS